MENFIHVFTKIEYECNHKTSNWKVTTLFFDLIVVVFAMNAQF